MNSDSIPSPVSRASAYWASWQDGFWLGLSFGIAAALSFSLPMAAFGWAAKAAGEGSVKAAVLLFGTAFLVFATPVIFSRVFREMDFPSPAERRRKPQVARSESPAAQRPYL